MGFALFGDGTDFANWVEVFLNGVRVNFNDVTFGWAITVPTQTLATRARPITDAILTFTGVQTGTVQIVGARRPRRTSQFNEGTGVPTRNFNQVLSDIVSQNREIWDKNNDMTGRGLFSQPGNTVGPLPLPAACQNKFLGFDATGLIPQCNAGGVGSGNVVGPATSVAGNAALFNNTTGTLLSDAGSPPVLTSQLATAVAAFLATPSSANLRAAMTDETGTGLAYFQGGALGTPASGVGTNLTGTAAGLTAGNATVAATVTTIGAHQVTRANEVQGIARSVIGVTGNATADVADIQLTASQFLGTTAANTSLAGVGYGPAATAAQGQIPGETTTGSASAGNVGEYIESVIVSGSAISTVTATAKNVTSITLSAGDWDVSGNISWITTGTTSVNGTQISLSLITGTLDNTPGRNNMRFFPTNAPGAGTTFGEVVGPARFSLSGSTTVFLVQDSFFTVSTLTAYGIIRARRVR